MVCLLPRRAGIVALIALFSPQVARAQPAPAAAPAGNVVSAAFVTEVTRFLEAEISAHVAAVHSLDPPQTTVLGVGTKGDFTWGSFMRALNDVAALTGQRVVAGRDVPQLLGKLGLIEAAQGGKTFAQLGAALALRQWGTDLAKNPVWLSLSPKEQAAWRSLLDPGRFYDREKKIVINLPENYFGVAARIATMDFQMGLITDRAFADDLLERAAGQLTRGALFTDDNLPTGRYDRYSQEYARFVYEAAGNIGRKDIQSAVEPSLKAVMKVWWDLVAPDGYGHPWGRTIGAISYMDSMEIVAFLAQHPEFRPAPLGDLAAVYHAAWRWLQHDYRPERHLIDMFGFGRGNFSYMTPERQWQQTTSFLGKAAHSLRLLSAALQAEKIAEFPAEPRLPAVARFQWYRQGDRPAGVWLVRQESPGGLRFALPIVTGTKSGVADYLPAPDGLPGFAPPVEQLAPALVPYLELQDGRVLVAGDGADEIFPDPSGKKLRVIWKRWAVVGGEAGQLVDPGLQAEVTWSLEGSTLVRKERLSAPGKVGLRHWRLDVPSTGGRNLVRGAGAARVDRFESPDGTLEIVATANFPLGRTLLAPGNGPLGKGHRGAIPLLLQLEARDLTVGPGHPLEWSLRMTAGAR